MICNIIVLHTVEIQVIKSVHVPDSNFTLDHLTFCQMQQNVELSCLQRLPLFR